MFQVRRPGRGHGGEAQPRGDRGRQLETPRGHRPPLEGALEVRELVLIFAIFVDQAIQEDAAVIWQDNRFFLVPFVTDHEAPSLWEVYGRQGPPDAYMEDSAIVFAQNIHLQALTLEMVPDANQAMATAMDMLKRWEP